LGFRIFWAHHAVASWRGGGVGSECAVAVAVVVLVVVHAAGALSIGAVVVLRGELGAAGGRGELVWRGVGVGADGEERVAARVA
jgi:hypothetical protein